MITLDSSHYAERLARGAREARSNSIPERPVCWSWLHGPVVPEVSPGDAKDRTARTGKWALR